MFLLVNGPCKCSLGLKFVLPAPKKRETQIQYAMQKRPI